MQKNMHCLLAMPIFLYYICTIKAVMLLTRTTNQSLIRK